jgi:hypothetical protein
MREATSPTSEQRVYVALDGDDVGRRIEQLIARGSESAVRAFSESVQARIRELADVATRAGGRLVFCAGDSLLAWVHRKTALALCRSAAARNKGVRFSGGIGPGMTEAMLALRLAKAQGRRRYVTWAAVVRVDRRKGAEGGKANPPR